MKLNNKNRKEFYKKIIAASKLGELTFIKDIINSDIANQITANPPKKMLENASGYGHIEIIKDLFTSKHLTKHINYPDILKGALQKAFQHGHLEVVKFLIPKIDNIGAYHNGLISSGVTDAAMTGKIELIRVFLEDSPIRNTIDKNELIGKIINIGCIYNQLEIVKYAIEKDNSQYFNKETNNINNTFVTSLTNGSMDVLKYFIFDLNIEKNSSLSNFLDTNLNENFEKVNNWFKIRDINKDLQEELPIIKNEKSPTKKLKM